MTLRLLTASDAECYRELRLAALLEYPEAFVTDYAEEAALSIEKLQERLAAQKVATTFGAFDGDQLIGIGTLLWSPRVRQKFRATIVGMYVEPQRRRRGVAKRLVAELVVHARTSPDIEEVWLCLTAGNSAARDLYLACGFQPEFVEPRSFKYEGRYHDLEWLCRRL